MNMIFFKKTICKCNEMKRKIDNNIKEGIGGSFSFCSPRDFI